MRITTTIALAAACALQLSALAGVAAAGKGKATTDRFEMVAPFRSPDAAARGRVLVRQRRGSAVTTVRMKGLAAGESYDVRDGRTNALLASATASRKGRARLKIKAAQPLPAATVKVAMEQVPGTSSHSVVVQRAASQRIVLMGASGATLDSFGSGDARFGTLRGARVDVSSFADAAGRGELALTLSARADGEERAHFAFVAGSFGTLALPEGADVVGDLDGAVFAIVDAHGDEVLRGEVPALQSLADLPAGGPGTIDLPIGDVADIVDYASPFTLRVALDGETFVDAGAFVASGEPVPGAGGWWDPDLLYGAEFYGKYFGDNVSLTMSSLFGDDLFSVSLFVATGPRGRGDTFSFSVTNGEGQPGLPFGITDVALLSGRRFEVRNAAGDAIVADVLPQLLPDNVLNPPGGPLFPDGEALQAPRTGPFTLWIDDEDGVLVEVATLAATGPSGF